MAASSIQSAHLVTPIVRCVCNVRARDAFDAPPGAAPFHRFLQANRLARPNLDTFELSTIHTPTASESPTAAGPMSAPLLPNLGEIIAVQPRPKVAVHETQLHQQLLPATFHALDIYA